MTAMTGKQRIEAVAKANDYTDQPDTGHGGWAQLDHVRRYTKGARRVSVYYDLTGRVVEVWTARSHRGPLQVNKAQWVIDYLNGA